MEMAYEKCKMIKLLIFSTMVFLLFFLTPSPVFALSSYVLPYPSFLPGNKIYTIYSIIQNLEKYWYFGNLSQFDYNLKQSDRYLVEAKTLFEYKQYVLARNSLEQSNMYFQKLNQSLIDAKQEGKDIEEKQAMLKNAALKHIEVLESIKNDLPVTFAWKEENALEVVLNLQKDIDNAINIRSYE